MASFMGKGVVYLGVRVGVGVLLVSMLCMGVSGDVKVAGAPLTYHGGKLLTGNLNIGIMWYGPIPEVQKKAILSFLRSLNTDGSCAADATKSQAQAQAQVSSWWHILESYQSFANTRAPPAAAAPIRVTVVNEQVDPNYSLGKVLIKDFIKTLLPKATGGKPNTLGLIVAPKGVTVQNMCAGSCAQHDFIGDQAYVAVGNPEEECPECAWPFMKSPNKGGPIQKPPSGDVGADAMVMLLAGGLAGAVTNPYGDGFYARGPSGDPIEANSKCANIFSTGKLLIDPVTGGSFNAQGQAATKFLLPGIWNPKTSSCWTPL